MIIISAWYGRFGNNVLQVLRAIHACKHLDHGVVRLPSHNLFGVTSMVIDGSVDETSLPIIESEFFYLEDVGIPNPSIETLRSIALDYGETFLDSRLNYFATDYQAAIHLRGGDVFSLRPHPDYVQPPLVYYQSAIASLEARPVALVSQDQKNPVYNKLKGNPNVTDVSGTLVSDFSYLLSAKVLVFSASTFCLAAMLLSQRVKTIHVPSYYLPFLPVGNFSGDIEVIQYDLPGYIKPGKWRNSFLQRRRMISYRASQG